MTRHPIREPLTKAERDKLRTHFDMAVEDGGMTDFELLQSILRLLDQVDALEERFAAAQLKTPNQILKCHGTPVSEGADSRGYAQPLNDPRA